MKKMKIAIIGGGFTGLSAAFKLSQTSHEITLFEKEKTLGGLAATYKQNSWSWPVEKHYHHWFTNDYYIIQLVKDLGISNKLFFPRTLTAIYYKDKIYPFNSPLQLLRFTPLAIRNRIRTGISTIFLKTISKSIATQLEHHTAYRWIIKYYGKQAFNIIWKPLLMGKFGDFAPQVNMTWFWARIKKRTFRLGYIKGGYQAIINEIYDNVRKRGVKILTNTSFDPRHTSSFDKVIVTAPSKVFLSLYPKLPQRYQQNLVKIPHLHALSLLLICKEKFLQDSYWLNINDSSFPFIAIVQQTNLVSSKYYGGKHLTYIANYLPQNHPYLKMSKEELFKIYLPHLQKINPVFNFSLDSASNGHIVDFQLFIGFFAQPVFPTNYSKIKPDFKTPIPNVYLANMDMIYPWDRGTNYAVELGYKVAEVVVNC